MKASTQYNDYKGTAAADISDYSSLKNYLKNHGVDIEKYEPVGLELDTNYSRFIKYSFICKDNDSDEKKLVKIRLKDHDDINEFLESNFFN